MKKYLRRLLNTWKMQVFGQIHHLMKMDIVMTIQKKLYIYMKQSKSDSR